MKKSPIFTAILMLFFASAYSPSLHAQFLKQLIDNVKQTAQGRANSKTSQTTNKAIDQVDPTTQTKSGTGNSTAGVGDTSSAAMAFKVLGLFTGVGGVSASDSAAAIKSFMTASGGSGIFYQYQTAITSTKGTNKGVASKDTSSTFITGASARSERKLNMPGVMTGEMTIIGHADQPRYSIMLNTGAKTYSLSVIDTSLINSQMERCQVTKIGTETIQGYSCVHVKMTSTSGSGLFKSSSTMDLWTSTNVPGYSFYKRLVSMQNVKPQMLQALDNAGAGGIIIRMDAGGKDYSMTMLLIRAEEKNLPASLFEIPAGYTDSKQNIMEYMLSGAKKQ